MVRRQTLVKVVGIRQTWVKVMAYISRGSRSWAYVRHGSRSWAYVTANGSKAKRARKIRRREWGGEEREGERETLALYFCTKSVCLFSSSK